MVTERSRIVRMAEDGGAGSAAADPAPVSTPAADAPAAAEPAPQEGLKDTLLTAELPTAEGERKGAGEGEKETPASEPIKPEDYKIDLPDGIAADDPLLMAFLEGAAKGGMNNESVQAVVSTLGPKLAEQLAAPMKAWIETNEAWQAAVKADPEMGGARLQATIKTVQDGMNLVGTPAEVAAFRQALFDTGAGNHPDVIRIMNRWCSRLVEKGAVQGNAPAESRSAAAVLYPSHNAAKGG